MTGGDGRALGGDPGPGERSSAPSGRAGLHPDSARATEIPGPRLSGKTRHAGTRRRPGPAPAQQQLMERISAARKARLRRALLMASGAMSALVLLAAGSAWALTRYVNGQIGRLNAGIVSTASSGPLNILVAGLDARTGLTPRQRKVLHVGRGTGPANTDTLMVVHVSADRHDVRVVSLPRDSWVSIPGHGMNQITAAARIGGPSLMVRTVEQDTGLTINGYVEVNFLGFVRVINALGGVSICLSQAVDDPYSGLRMSSGMHHVNGVTALKYARDRHSSARSDLGRIQDQQHLISSVLTEATSSGMLADPVRLGKLLSAASAVIKVDQGLNVVSLAGELYGISPNAVTFTTVPLSHVRYVTPSGRSALLWNSSAASALFTALRNDQVPPGTGTRTQGTRTQARRPTAHTLGRARVWLDIYNGTPVGGLSVATGTQLAVLGFRVDRSGADWTSHNITQTLIQYPAGQGAAARLVGQVMPGAALRQVNGLARLTIVVGQNGHAVTAHPPGTARRPGSGQGSSPSQQTSAAQDACRG
jgi:LCP family protein required for cell wall assembly